MKRKEIISEINLGDYLTKSSAARKKAEISAILGRSPEEKEKSLATFNKRDKGIERARSRFEKQQKADIENRLAKDIAELPRLRAEYEEMKDRYKSLGGSSWQYADRDQNLTDQEREARSIEGAMNALWRRINAAEKARKEGIEEGSLERKASPEKIKHRIIAVAHDWGDDWGEDPETAIEIAKMYKLDPEFVQRVLSGQDQDIEETGTDQTTQQKVTRVDPATGTAELTDPTGKITKVKTTDLQSDPKDPTGKRLQATVSAPDNQIKPGAPVAVTTKATEEVNLLKKLAGL